MWGNDGINQNGYRLQNIKIYKIYKNETQIARNIIFNENTFYYNINKLSPIKVEDFNDSIVINEIEVRKEFNNENKRGAESDNSQTEALEQVYDEGKRNRNVPKRFNDYEMYMAFDALSFRTDS